MLLVDFNLAEHLEPEANVKEKQIVRTVSCVPTLVRKLPSLSLLPGNTSFYCTSC